MKKINRTGSFTAECPRCGVYYSMMPRTYDKRVERGFSEWDVFICNDCKPMWRRKERVTNDQIWESYCKANGISV